METSLNVGALPSVIDENLADSQHAYVTGRRKWLLLVSLAVVLFMLMGLYAAVLMVLLPSQVQSFDAANKVNTLGLILTITSVFSTLATPLGGALSDRTSSRFGRRNPWVLAGGIAGGVSLMLVPFANTLTAIVVLWLIAVVTLNMMQASLTVVLAERFVVAERGLASGVSGSAMMAGFSCGTYLAGRMANDVNLVYVVIGAAIAFACFAFVVANPEPNAGALPRQDFQLGNFLKGFWIDPKKNPDFMWAFFGRLVLFIGYCTVQSYLYYILQDYFKLEQQRANEMIASMSLITMAGQVVSGIGCGMLSDAIGRRKPLVFGAGAMMAVAVAVPLVSVTTMGLYVYAALLGLGYGAFMSVDLALMTQVLPKPEAGSESSGKDLGILTISVTVPQMLSPAIGAGLLGLTGNNYSVLFIFAAIFAMAGAALVMPIKAVR